MSQLQAPRLKAERLRCIHCYNQPHHHGPCEFVGREEFKRRIRGDEKEML